MLWIALHLPALSLESFAATLPHGPEQRPLALLDGHAIGAANAAARALGIQPGLKRATALALAPHITLGQADPQRDAQALTTVAHVALAFTPTVVIQPPSEAAPGDTPHTVLLEVQASLRYFGGLPALLRRLHEALAPLGHRVHSVSASTALGAALLARVHPRLDCPDLFATRKALDRAPVWLLGPGRIHWEALQGMGLRTIAELRAVPRDGLARRFGEVVLGELDRATGHRPDPREAIELPATFESRLELFARADTTDQLLHGATVLLARLVAWLAARHAFVRRFTLRMAHERRSRRDETGATPTALEIALAEPSRDPVHLLVLLRERLAALQLPAPTLDLSLHADDIAQRAPPNAELFPTPAAEHEGLTRLIERLQARLGRDQVRRLVPLPDHRPEHATTTRIADAAPRRPARARGAKAQAAPVLSPHAVRPVWLLQCPEPLRERQHQGDAEPLVDGQPLLLVSGPERIESGWWDGQRVERDYFIAELPGGALVWVYCSRVQFRPLTGLAEPKWFLQGRFG